MVLTVIACCCTRQEAILTEYQNMLARLSTIFAQQKALVTRLSRPLPMTPDDINVVRSWLGLDVQNHMPIPISLSVQCCSRREADSQGDSKAQLRLSTAAQVRDIIPVTTRSTGVQGHVTVSAGSGSAQMRNLTR